MEVELGFSWHTLQNYKLGIGVRIFLGNQIHNLLYVTDIDKEGPWIWSRMEKVSRLKGGKESLFKKWDYNTISQINNKNDSEMKLKSERDNINIFLHSLIVYMYIFEVVCACAMAFIKVRRQLKGVSFLISQCRLYESNSGFLSWLQAPLHSEPSLQPQE